MPQIHEPGMPHIDARTVPLEAGLLSESTRLEKLLQKAWAITLSIFFCSENVVFYYRASQDGTVDLIESVIETHVDNNEKIDQIEPHVSTVIPGVESVTKRELSSVQQSTVTDTNLNGASETDRSSSADEQELPLEQEHLGAPSIHQTRQGTLRFACGDGPEEIYFEFDVPKAWKARLPCMLRTFENVFAKACIQPHGLVKDLELCSAQDLAQLALWNAVEHRDNGEQDGFLERIENLAAIEPRLTAVDAWDGKLSYRELHDLSSKLSGHLMENGLGLRREKPEYIPILTEKSRITAVAMLAAMKIGCPFVLIDSSLPASRIQAICVDLESPLLICSPATATTAEVLAPATVCLGENLFNESWSKTPSNLPVEFGNIPDHPLYVVFTSGSTGKPKGITINRDAFFSCARPYVQKVGLNRDTRTLQFASYAFDVSISDTLNTLLVGGCLCIPSDYERSHQLSVSIRAFEPTWADLTPSLLRHLSEKDLHTIKTVVVSGEALSRDVVDSWAGRVRLINVYGPAECSVQSTMSMDVSENTASNIGHAIVGATWVVDPDDHGSLKPIGAIGELLIGGPHLAQGYLNDPIKTAGAFIMAPRWLKHFSGNGTNQTDELNRLYCTGDLVQYEEDGSLRYIGRKDTQIKLRGQRIELEEIEHHIRKCLPSEYAAAVEAISLGEAEAASAVLVAFISQPHAHEHQAAFSPLIETPVIATMALFSDILDSLQRSLPDYMIPSFLLPVSHLPLTASGKVDRRRLREEATRLSRDDWKLYSDSNSDGKSTQSTISFELCEIIAGIFAKVLNIEINCIGDNDDFFALGGDSITAMRVVALCRQDNITLDTGDILQHRTVHNIASVARVNLSSSSSSSSSLSDSSQDTWKDESNVPFGLSPIQSMFFDDSPNGDSYFNQSMLLQCSRVVDVVQLRRAVHAVIGRHPMLRARFSRAAYRSWTQRVTENIEASFMCSQHYLTDKSRLTETMNGRQKDFNLEHGPIFLADLIHVEGKTHPLLFVNAHHAVIDLVSYRIILEDLEEFLCTEELPTASSMTSFHHWCRLEEEHAVRTLSPDGVLPKPLHINNTFLDKYWALHNSSNTYGNAITTPLIVNATTTQKILSTANAAFRTEPVELLNAALLHSFLKVFADREPPIIFNEGHGREPWQSNIDISRTVGWFTTIWPIQVDFDQYNIGDIGDLVRRVKDSRRQVPGKGLPYFASRYLNPEGKEAFGSQKMEIVFNFHGKFQQLEREGSLFQQVMWEYDATADYGPSTVLPGIFEVTCVVINGCFKFDFIYGKSLAHQEQILQWINGCAQSLDQIAARFLSSACEGPTLVDLPLMGWNYGNMAHLEQTMSDFGYSMSDIEKVHPCIPMQEGILLSRARKSSLYRTGSILQFKSRSSKIEVNALCEAWKQIVARHSVLRTMIVGGTSEAHSYISIVLKPGVTEFALSTTAYQAYSDERIERESVLDMLRKSRLSNFPIIDTPYQVKLFASHNAKSIFCDIEFNHAIMDGWSSNVLIEEWLSLYNSSLRLPDPMNYSNYVGYVLGKSACLDYWREYLNGVESCSFPNLSGDEHTREAEIYNVEVDLKQSDSDLATFFANTGATLPSLFHLAWAILLRSYVGGDEVCFGYLTSGRDAPFPGIERAVGLFANLLPFRLAISDDTAIESLLQDGQVNLGRSLSNQNISMLDIQAVSNQDEALFNTVVSIQYQKSPSDDNPQKEESQLFVDELEESDPTEYDLALNVYLAGANSKAYVSCWTSAISKWKARHLANMLSGIIEQIIAYPQKKIKELSLLRNSQHDFLSQYDTKMPIAIDECVHNLIYKHVHNSPNTAAINAWDRQLSYSELDTESSKIARRINDMGYGVGDWIPLFLHRSSWVPVVMLGVMKSGAAFVFLEIALPRTRLQQICADTMSTIILTTRSLHEKAEEILDSVVSVDDEGSHSPTTDKTPTKPSPAPSDALYAIFTSGSTGNPKGVVIEHSAFASSALSHAPVAGYTAESRVLQFSSYTFDACMVEVMTTLIVGGCVCIPSEHDRWNDLPGAMANLNANLLFVTPSMLRGLEPSLFPNLKTILVGGEALAAGDFQRWLGSAKVVQMYGPTECSAYSAATAPLHVCSDIRNIGDMVGARPWIVEPRNPGILSPIGAVGELLLEGPIVGRGYLNRPKQTAAAFIAPPIWRGDFPCSANKKFYRTGDLVQYAENGTIRILGRKDSQVKLRGQRIELGEIEHALHDILPDYKHICVELVTQEDESRSAMIVALVGNEYREVDRSKKVSSDSRGERLLQPIPKLQQDQIDEAKMQLSGRLPHYMNPSLFLDIKQLPFTAGGKADRRRLRAEAADFISTHLRNTNMTAKNMEENLSLTPVERQVLEMVASVLGRTPSELAMQDDFFKVGGDSLRAMRLAQLARSQNVQLSVQDIFQCSKLASLAKCFQTQSTHDSQPEQETRPAVPRLSLLNAHGKDNIMQEVASELQLDQSQIEDIYPCTPLQEGMVSLTLRSPEAYVMQRTHALPSYCDMSKLKKAWNLCIKSNPILRTRILQTQSGGTLQVVLHGEPEWIMADDLEAYLSLDREKCIGLKEPLLRLALISEPPKKKQEDRKRFMVITMHHAIYDGWSEELILNQAESAYEGNSLTSRPFSPFIKHLKDTRNDSETFWRLETSAQEMSPASFPALPAPEYQPAPNSTLQCTMNLTNGHKASQSTVSTQVRLSWATVLHHFTSSERVVFGVVSNGRTAPLSGIEAMTGPTIATFPFKVHFESSKTVQDMLFDTQSKSISMLPFEQFGLQNIRALSPSAAEECRFQSLLVVQPEPEQSTLKLMSAHDSKNPSAAFDTYPLTLQCNIGPAQVEIEAIFDNAVVSEEMMHHVLGHFKHVFSGIAQDLRRPIDQMQSVSCTVKAQLTEWYKESQRSLLSSYPSVHELIKIQCQLQPGKAAIAAWDGDLSYKRLDELSSVLAMQLTQSSVGPGSIVPICYEKSKWLAVIMLAVIKAGAAFVLLDASSQPIQRMQLIVGEVKSSVIITSKQLESTARQLLADQIVVVSEDSFFWADDSNVETILPDANSSTALYTIFTSGSTGKPKGVVIEHGGYTAGALSRQTVTGLTRDSRVLQFSSCTFDTFITDIFDTLIAGGCICIPSEADRHANLAHFARNTKVTYADLVPSVARLLIPQDVPTLEILALSGEPMTISDVATWADKIRLCNLYGPAECSAVATAHVVSSSHPNASNIGRVCGGMSWIVSPTNHDILLPIGAVGELILEGPIVGRGYLGKVDEMASSNYVQDVPGWRSNFPPPKSSCRMYKTGDLVQYQSDGTLLFMGRKDNQTKLHGQRLELGDVEHHVRQAFSRSIDAVAIITSNQMSAEHLVAFVVVSNKTGAQGSSDSSDGTQGLLTPKHMSIVNSTEFQSQIRSAEALLRNSLPSFMVPTAYFPTLQLPRTPSGKVDRAILKQMASDHISSEGLGNFTAKRERRDPSTVSEKSLREIWAKVLALEPSTISVEDGFLQLGGDSIMAMKVAALARSRGLKLSIPRLFQNQSLQSLASDTAAHQDVQPINWALETALPLRLHSGAVSDTNITDNTFGSTCNGEILLSGATGRLGREILKQLLGLPAVSKVHCVAVREPEQCSTHEKIITYKGDLSLPRLGLSETEEASLVQSCSAIIHCGARVSFVQNYETMRQVNVHSTTYLASLALKRNIPFHFISTVGVGHRDGDLHVEEVSAAPNAPPEDGVDGYTATKWVSEVLLENFHARFGFPVTIHRPSNIICDGDPESDIVNNLLVYSRRLGMVPELSVWEGSFDFVSSATAAYNIIGSVMSGIQLVPGRESELERSGVQYIHESGETVFPVNDLASYLGSAEAGPLDVVGLQLWVKAALEAGMRSVIGDFLLDMDKSGEKIALRLIKSRRRL